MTHSSDNDESRERTSETRIAELLRSAPSRPVPTLAAAERVKAAAYDAYLDYLQHRSRRRWRLGIAASITIMVVAGFFLQQRSTTPVVVAHITRTVGNAAKVDAAVAMTEQPLRTYETVSVPQGGRLLLTLTNGVGLRVDESTRLVFESPDRLRLDHGAVYVETPRHSTADPGTDLVVETAYGAVRHVGTQYEVRVAERELRVRVREGAVLFRTSSGTNTMVKAGEQLDYERDIATVVPGPGRASNAWAWTEVVGPRYVIEGRSLAEALEWFASEAGMRLEFTNEKSRTRATQITLHGDVSTLTLRQAMRAILSGSDLPYAIEESRLLVGPN